MARPVFDTQTPKDPTEAEPREKRQPVARRKPIVKGGATSEKYIRAATQGGAERTYQEIAVDQVGESAIRDRIDVEEDLDSLVDSIRENGQQIPILVRLTHSGELPYEIVVGRRRLAAHRRLGMPRIKAFVARMDDREAFIAQGIENSARLETSYIERARAAAQGVEAGYSQADVAEFLNISRTLMNFMIKTYQSLGEDLVMAIGPARGIGRRKWDALVTAMTQNAIAPETAIQMIDHDVVESVDRFEALLRSVQSAPRKAPSPAAEPDRKSYLDGRLQTVRKPRQLVVKTDRTLPQDVLNRISASIAEIVSDFEKNKNGER